MCFVNVFIGFAVIAILRTVSHRRAAEHAEKIVLSKNEYYNCLTALHADFQFGANLGAL